LKHKKPGTTNKKSQVFQSKGCGLRSCSFYTLDGQTDTQFRGRAKTGTWTQPQPQTMAIDTLSLKRKFVENFIHEVDVVSLQTNKREIKIGQVKDPNKKARLRITMKDSNEKQHTNYHDL
jgi:hypothetical protein